MSSEFRQDPLTGRWVIIAPGRAERPDRFQTESAIADTPSDEPDPFLEGNEAETPSETLAYRERKGATDAPGWSVRVVPNKYPALEPTEPDVPEDCDGLFRTRPGAGMHEVIVECPHDESSLARLPAGQIANVFRSYRDRLNALKGDGRIAYVLIFKNHGAAGGATVAHSHSQLIATPVVPPVVEEELRRAEAYHRERGRCLFDDVLQEEAVRVERIVLDTPSFVVYCPFAARFPYELAVLPRRHDPHFETISEAEIDELGMVIKAVLSKLEMVLDDPPYNYVLHTAPFGGGNRAHYHWHLEVFPRMVRTAGFEWGGGIHINPVPPEQAAARLRETDAETPHDSR